MADEGSFLRAVLANPADDLPRLVYADWLDEQGTEDGMRKAEFLRWQVAISRGDFKPGGRTRKERRRQLRARHLAETLPAGWLAAVSHAAVEGCAFGGTAVDEWPLRRQLDVVNFAYECPKDWASLTPTEEEKVRHCGACGEEVYYCEDITEAANRAQRGQCVAISAALTRQPGDLEPREYVTMGIMLPDDFEREEVR